MQRNKQTHAYRRNTLHTKQTQRALHLHSLTMCSPTNLGNESATIQDIWGHIDALSQHTATLLSATTGDTPDPDGVLESVMQINGKCSEMFADVKGVSRHVSPAAREKLLNGAKLTAQAISGFIGSTKVCDCNMMCM